jgi:hypothetical protein
MGRWKNHRVTLGSLTVIRSVSKSGDSPVFTRVCTQVSAGFENGNRAADGVVWVEHFQGWGGRLFGSSVSNRSTKTGQAARQVRQKPAHLPSRINRKRDQVPTVFVRDLNGPPGPVTSAVRIVPQVPCFQLGLCQRCFIVWQIQSIGIRAGMFPVRKMEIVTRHDRSRRFAGEWPESGSQAAGKNHSQARDQGEQTIGAAEVFLSVNFDSSSFWPG